MPPQLQRSYLAGLRSSAAADGGRCPEGPAMTIEQLRVAILGRRGRRPLLNERRHRRVSAGGCDPRPPRTAAAASASRTIRPPGWSCDPRPPRTAAAASRPSCFVLPPGCCDPRPPRTAAAATTGPRRGDGPSPLRSSAAADGGRCLLRTEYMQEVDPLRSSAAADGGRCFNTAFSMSADFLLRSSAAADGGRCRGTRRSWGSVLSCDPRPPRTAAAASPLSWRRPVRAGCDPRPPRTAAAASLRPPAPRAPAGLRSSAAADGGRCRWTPRSYRCGIPRCDPRPPRTAAAAGEPHLVVRRANTVAILGRRGRRPLHNRTVESLGRTVSLRSSAAADGGRCPTR